MIYIFEGPYWRTLCLSRNTSVLRLLRYFNIEKTDSSISAALIHACEQVGTSATSIESGILKRTLNQTWVANLTEVVSVWCQYRTRAMPVALEVKCTSYPTGDCGNRLTPCSPCRYMQHCPIEGSFLKLWWCFVVAVADMSASFVAGKLAMCASILMQVGSESGARAAQIPQKGQN